MLNDVSHIIFIQYFFVRNDFAQATIIVHIMLDVFKFYLCLLPSLLNDPIQTSFFEWKPPTR